LFSEKLRQNILASPNGDNEERRKSMKTRWSFVGVALLAISLAGAFSVYGQPGAGHGGRHWGEGGGLFPFRVLGALNLTTEQQAKIQSVNDAHRETLKTLYHNLRSVKDEVTTKFLTSGDVATENFADQAGRIASLEGQLFQEQLAVGVEVHKVLTPDQLTRAANLIAQQKALRAEWKGSQKTEQ
jgi:Spy/CpxP family protein refolding chaperone